MLDARWMDENTGRELQGENKSMHDQERKFKLEGGIITGVMLKSRPTRQVVESTVQKKNMSERSI